MLIENILYPPIKNYQKSLITSKFNAVRGNKKHKGLDIGVKSGTEVFAPADGVVIDSDSNRSTCGGFIKIKHDDDIVTKYCHLRKVLVKPKDVVKVGQLIGLSGGDQNDPGKGHTTGAHLHFEVIRRGEFLNPEDVFGSNQITNIKQVDDKIDLEYKNVLSDKNKFKTYDLKKIDKFDVYDLNKTESLNLKATNINEEENSDEETSLESDLGNIIKDSFTNISCKDKSKILDDGSFVDMYTYRPNSSNFCCRFSKCKMINDENQNCKKIEVLFKGTTHIINVCSNGFNIIDRTTKNNELIAKIPSLTEYIDVYVTKGLSTKVKLINSTKLKKSSKQQQSSSSKSSFKSSKLTPLSTSEKDTFKTPYILPKTSEKDTFKTPYNLKNINNSSSGNFYQLPATSEKDSFINPKKLPATSENKILKNRLITEINRIISIMK